MVSCSCTSRRRLRICGSPSMLRNSSLTSCFVILRSSWCRYRCHAKSSSASTIRAAASFMLSSNVKLAPRRNTSRWLSVQANMMAAELAFSVKYATTPTTSSFPKLSTACMIERIENNRLMPLSGLILLRLGLSGCHVNRRPICINSDPRIAKKITSRNGNTLLTIWPNTAAANGSVSPRSVGFVGVSAARKTVTSVHHSFGPITASVANADNSRTAAVRSWLRATCPLSRASRRRRGVGASVFSSRSAAIRKSHRQRPHPYRRTRAPTPTRQAVRRSEDPDSSSA